VRPGELLRPEVIRKFALAAEASRFDAGALVRAVDRDPEAAIEFVPNVRHDGDPDVITPPAETSTVICSTTSRELS
jgi:hypothetical protein